MDSSTRPWVPTVLVAGAAAITLAAPATAQPNVQVAGNGVFRVGVEIEPGTYRSPGPSNPLILVLGDVSPISLCSWSLHSTPAATDADLTDAGNSLGPALVNIPATAAAFKTQNCQPWTRSA